MQKAIPSVNELEQRSDTNRQHWSASSQTYAPASVLLGYLADGWAISPIVGREACWRGGGRHITIYHFELTRNNQMVAMPVLGNPIVRRLVDQQQFRVVERNLTQRVDGGSEHAPGVIAPTIDPFCYKQGKARTLTGSASLVLEAKHDEKSVLFWTS